jgi:hypothetical protein
VSWYRWLACTLCLAAVDAIAIFLLLALSGFIAGLGRAPLGWGACEAVILAAVLLGALGDLLPRARRAHRIAMLLAGLVAVALGALSVGRGMPHAAWALAVLACAALWLLGMRRALGPATPALIAASFRRGVLVFVLALALEALGSLALGTHAVLVPFFVLALTGMALARAPQRSARRPAWHAAAAMSAAALLVAGAFALAALAVVTVRGGAGLLRDAWLAAASAVDASVRATLEELLGEGAASDLTVQPAAAEPSDAFVIAMLLAGAALMAWGATRLLHARRELLPRIVLDLAQEEREALDPGDSRGLSWLFERLLPPWLRRRRGAPPELPPQPGIRDVALLYYRMLDLARARGAALDPAHTPHERRASLRRVLPGAPVDALTGRFEAACYGAQPAPPAAVAALTRALNAAGAPQAGAPRPR